MRNAEDPKRKDHKEKDVGMTIAEPTIRKPPIRKGRYVRNRGFMTAVGPEKNAERLDFSGLEVQSLPQPKISVKGSLTRMRAMMSVTDEEA